jgi:hypothetical protein
MARVVSLRAFSSVGAGALGGVVLVAVAAAAVSLAQGCSVGVVSGNFATEGGAFGGDDGGSSSGGASGDATTCQPGDVRTFAPQAYTPASPPWQDACSLDQLMQAYTACFDPTNLAITTTCAAFSDPDASTGSCAACLITPSTAAAFGPYISRGANYVAENASGCIELTGPGPGGLTCAKAQQALDGCELAACAAFCPAYDKTSRDGLDGCMTMAAAGGCQMFAQQASCASTVAEAGKAAQCTGLSPHEFFWAVAPLFCGDAPDGSAPLRDGSFESSDAGSGGDATGPTDASADAGGVHDAAGDTSTPDAPGPSSDAAGDAPMTTDGQADTAAD